VQLVLEGLNFVAIGCQMSQEAGSVAFARVFWNILELKRYHGALLMFGLMLAKNI